MLQPNFTNLGQESPTVLKKNPVVHKQFFSERLTDVNIEDWTQSSLRPLHWFLKHGNCLKHTKQIKISAEVCGCSFNPAQKLAR